MSAQNQEQLRYFFRSVAFDMFRKGRTSREVNSIIGNTVFPDDFFEASRQFGEICGGVGARDMLGEFGVHTCHWELN